MSVRQTLTRKEMRIVKAIKNNDVAFVESLKDQTVNFFDARLNTPLHQACVQENKEIVEILIDKGAQVNLADVRGFTALHLAGMLGNVNICQILLLAGAKRETVNDCNKTPAQAAVTCRKYNCAAYINNFISLSDISPFILFACRETSSLLLILARSFVTFVSQINIHPIKIALRVRHDELLRGHLKQVNMVLKSMCSSEIEKGINTQAVKAFKLHYIGYVTDNILKLEESMPQEKVTTKQKQFDCVEALVDKLLKNKKQGMLEDMENFLKEGIRDFPDKNCEIIKLMLSRLARTASSSALNIIAEAINGTRPYGPRNCRTCGEERALKYCKCKSASYCNEECQRLHWPIHKKQRIH